MWFEFTLIVITLLLSGFFSGSEIAFVTANRLKLEIKSRQGSLLSKNVGFFLKNPQTFLSTTLLGNNIVNVVYATLMTLLLTEPINHSFAQLFGYPPSELFTLFIQTTLASVLIMIFGEILPKAIFRTHADFFVNIVSVPLRLVNIIFKPLIFLVDAVSKLLLRLFHAETSTFEQVYRRQDIELLMQEIRQDGATDLDDDDSEILSNVLELASTRVKEVMIPRTEVVAIAKNTHLDHIRNTFIKTGFSRLPVFEESIDNIIGVAFAYDLFNQPKSITEIMRPIRVVPSTQRAKSLLTDFRRDSDSMAVVLDEYGGTAGIITLEDLLEEVVGDIRDEYDTDDHFVKKFSDGSFIFSGGVEIEFIQEKHPELNLIDSENHDYETIAGFVIFHLGRIPKVNEELIIKDLKFIISKATPSRIETLKVIPR